MGQLSMYLFLCFWCLPFLCRPWAYVDAAVFIQATGTPAAVAHGRQAYLLIDSSFCFMTSFLGLAPVPRPILDAVSSFCLPRASRFFPWALNLAHGWDSLGPVFFLPEPALGCLLGLGGPVPSGPGARLVPNL